MNISLAFMRIFFMILSIFFMTTFMLSSPIGSPATNSIIGVIIGLLFGFILVGFDTLFRRFNLRAFNVAIIGIFIGYLMGQAIVLTFDAVLEISSISMTLQPQTLEIIKIALFLFGTYLGAIMTLRASDELYISIPFVKFAPMVQKKKDLLIDQSVLADARIIDVAATGVFDHQLVVPRFVLKEIYAQSETGDEVTKTKARRALDVLKKLEALPTLALRFNDTDFPEVKELSSKMGRLARLIDANLLSADVSRAQTNQLDGVRVINLHTLASALKPLMQAGEFIKIKIQRYGKEAEQGVGYLEDGTMVVVNGGGKYIGETIECRVLSVKHTSAGRMIFCNALDLETPEHEEEKDEDENE
ncbi:MAG: PIN/TRAM domain-containing protein [Chlamydiales bacterium]